MRPETVIQELAGYKIQDITLDPVEGYIYWTTLHSIGASRLDGSEYSAIVNVMPNFGKYILGLALDSEKGYVFVCLLHFNSYSASRDNWCTVGGDGGCRVDEVRAGTTSPMPDHKGFKLQ